MDTTPSRRTTTHPDNVNWHWHKVIDAGSTTRLAADLAGLALRNHPGRVSVVPSATRRERMLPAQLRVAPKITQKSLGCPGSDPV